MDRSHSEERLSSIILNMTTKHNKLINTILKKAKSDFDPKKKKSVILHDGSKESAKILRSFLPFWMNKDRQMNNNIRAAFATHMGVWKPSMNMQKEKPVIEKAEKPQKPLPKRRKAKSKVEKPDTSLKELSVPAVQETKAEKQAKKEKAKARAAREEASGKQEISQEEQIERDLRNQEIYNSMELGGIEDDKVISSTGYMLNNYCQVLRRFQDTNRPGSVLDSGPYKEKIGQYQNLIAQQFAYAIASFVLFQHKQFLDNDLNIDLMGMLGEKFKGATKHRRYAIGAFKELISAVGQRIKDNKKLVSFGTGIFKGSPDSRKKYDFERDFKQKFDMDALVEATRNSLFLPETDENYGDFISGALGEKIKATMNEISQNPRLKTSNNNMKFMTEIIGNMIGIIPDSAVKALTEYFRHFPQEIKENTEGSAQREQLEDQYARFEHLMNTVAKLTGDDNTQKPTYRKTFIEKAVPGIKEATIGKNKINSEILDNVDSGDLMLLKQIMDDAVKNPNDFLEGIFMTKVAKQMTSMREASVKDPNSKFKNWLPHSKEEDIQFYEKMFDAVMYIAREYHPGSANLARSAIDHVIYQKDQDMKRKQAAGEMADDSLIRQMNGYRDILNLRETRLADPTSNIDDVYKQWKSLSDANQSNTYDTEARKDAMKQYGLELGSRLGDKDITNPVDSNILKTQQKIKKINDFFGDPENLDHKVFDGDSLMSRISELRAGDPKAVADIIKEFNKNVYEKAEENMGEISRAAKIMGKSTQDIVEDLMHHRGYDYNNLFNSKPSDLKKVTEAAVNAYEKEKSNPGILGGKSAFEVPTKELTALTNAYEKSKADEVRNVAKNFESLAGGFMSLNPTRQDYEQWEEDQTTGEHFMRDVISMHYGFNRIREILQDKPYDPLTIKYKQFMNDVFLPRKDQFLEWVNQAGGDIKKLYEEAVKYGAKGFMGEEHRKEIEEGDKKIHDKMKLEELKEMLNSKISQEMYEKQGLIRQGEFFKYVENEEGEPDLVLHRLTKDKKSGQIVEKKVSQREIKQRDEDFLTAIPQLSKHYNLTRSQRSLMRRFAQAKRALSKSKPQTIGYGRYSRIVNDTRKELGKILPETVISGLEDVSGMPFRNLKQDTMSSILSGIKGDKAKYKFTNSFVVDPYSSKVQGIESGDLVKIANQTSQDRNAYVVPDTKEGQTTAISGLDLLIGDPEASETEGVDLNTGVGPAQMKYMKDNQKLKKVLGGQDIGNNMRVSDEIFDMQGPVDYRTLSDYGQKSSRFGFSNPVKAIPKAIKTGKGKTMEGIGDVLGRVFKEDDPSWMEVIE